MPQGRELEKAEKDRDKKLIYHMETIHHRKFWLMVLLTNGKNQKRSATIRSNFSSDKIRRTFSEQPL